MNKQNANTNKSALLGNAVLALKASVACVLAAMGVAHAAPPAPGELPRNGTVVSGQATIATLGEAMTINQASQRAIIDWQSFNVGSAASVHFNQQQGSSSVTLNRVLDAQPSQIFGRITAPGQVFLVNPGGVYFSPTAKVDVGGLVATTHAIANEDFMAGRYVFERQGAQGSILNEGELKSALGGYIALLAPEVRNQGVILAQAGTAALAAGETFELQMQGQNTLAGISVTPSTMKALVDNRWAVIAEDGLIILSARAADQLQGGVINNSGSLVANSLTEMGGRIMLTADTIDLAAGSRIDASGAKGGGTVLVGGDWQGGGGVYQATHVSMASDASVDVSATLDGDGGKAVFWTDLAKLDSLTAVHGLIRARGAGSQGRGGQVETSGHKLSLQGIRVDAGAPSGRGGQWLLDPIDFTIAPALGDVDGATISFALFVGTNVTIDTIGTPPCVACAGSNGDIFINDVIDGTGGAPSGTLTILAERNIQMASGMTIANDNTVQLVAGRYRSAGDSTGGNIILAGSNSITAPLVLLYSGSLQEPSLANLVTQLGGSLLYNLDSSFVGPSSGVYAIYRDPSPTQATPVIVTASLTGQYLPVLSDSGTSLASAELLATLDLSPGVASAGSTQGTGLAGSEGDQTDQSSTSPGVASADPTQGTGQPGSGVAQTKAKDSTASASRAPIKGKVREGLMVSPPPVKGFKRAYVVLLGNPDGTTGEIVVKGAKGEQVVSDGGYGVPLDGSVAPQKVSDQLMEQDFSNARKAAESIGAQQGNP